MKTTTFTTAAVAALAVVAGASSAQAAEAKKCKAKAFFSRKNAFHSGIVFVHGNKTHDVIYGTFQGGLNYTDTQTPLLKDGVVGYDEQSKAYGWGSVAEYGFLGSANDFLFGLQMAMGSVAGLMMPDVEEKLRKALHDQDVGETPLGLGFSELQTNNGRALNTGIEAALNSTQTRINRAQEELEENRDGQQNRKRAVMEARDEDCDEDDEEENFSKAASNAKSRVASNNDSKKAENAQSRVASSSNNDSHDSNGSNDSSNSNESGSAFQNPPSVSVVYRPPWKTARPVYFFGQCENCDDQTGYTPGGHGKFQSCTLIYRGQEYNGTAFSNRNRHMCDIDFDC